MSLTRVTSTVVSSNAITSAQLSNNIIEARHIKDESVGLGALSSAANTASVETRLNANLNVLDSNADAIETRRVANVTEQTAIETRRNDNTAGAVSSILTTNLTASRALSSDSSGKVAVATTTLAELNFVNGVTSAIQTQLDAVESRRAANNITTTFTDDVIVTGNLIVNGDTTTSNSVNMIVQDRMIMLANSATGSPSDDIGFLFNRGNQGNAAFFYDESAKTFKVSDTKDPFSNTTISPVTASNLDVGILTAATVKYDGADLNTSITDNVAALTTNINTLDANADAIESRRVTNVSVAASNDFVTFTRLNANINVVSSNTVAAEVRLNANLDVVQDNVAALTGGATLSVPFQNVNTSVGSSNVFFIGKDVANQSNITLVALDGVFQTSSDYVLHTSNETIQFKEATIPSGVVFQVHVLTAP